MFDHNSILEGASLNPAPGTPATASERAAIDWRVQWETAGSWSAAAALYTEYDSYLSDVYERTGKRLINPLLAPEMRGRYGTSVPVLEEQLQSDLADLREEFPDLPVRTPESIRDDIGRQRAALFQQQAEVTARTIDPFVSAAGYGATMGAAVADPPVLMSMFVGAPAATGILRGALIDAGIGALTEIPVQTAVQLGRRQFGEEPSLSEGLFSVAAAGGGGFLLSAFLRGAGASVRPAARGLRDLVDRARGLPRRNADVRAAEAYLERMADMEEASPFADTVEARAEHARRISAAEEAIRDGRVADMPEAQAPLREKVEPSGRVPDNVIEAIGIAARDAARLDMRERAGVETLTALLGDERALGEVFQGLRKGPEKSETLLGFLQRNGGIRDEGGELKNLGLTSRTRPGLLRKQGRPLDDATLVAWEAGFLPGGERPEINDLLDAIREEMHGSPVLRQEDMPKAGEQAALDELGEALIDAGIDWRAMKLPQFVAAIRGKAEALIARDLGDAIQRGRRMGEASKEAAELEGAASDRAAMDAFDEQDVRRLYDGREGTVLTFETEDGLERQSVRDLYDELTGDQMDYESLTVCTGKWT